MEEGVGKHERCSMPTVAVKEKGTFQVKVHKDKLGNKVVVLE